MPVTQQVEEEKKQKDADKIKTKVAPEKLYEVMKALTAMKLVKEDGVPGAVYDDIFLGSIGAAYNKEELEKHGITHILTCAAKIKPRFPDEFKYHLLNALDSPNQNVLQLVDQSNKFLDECLSANVAGEPPKNKVLIHCFAGKSRATTFLLAYLIKVRKMTLKDGLEQIWKARSIAAPNPGFMI